MYSNKEHIYLTEGFLTLWACYLIVDMFVVCQIQQNGIFRDDCHTPEDASISREQQAVHSGVVSA